MSLMQTDSSYTLHQEKQLWNANVFFYVHNY